MSYNWSVHPCCLHQHTPGENSVAFRVCPCSASYQSDDQWHWQWPSAKGLVDIPPQRNLLAPSSSTHSTVTQLVTAPVDRSQCFICSESFGRRQERDRHLLKHLPYFLHCPIPHCGWRGNRTDLFKKHWLQESHRPYHKYYGYNPEGGQIETYNPREILNEIKNGTISFHEGEDRAIVLVQVKACELQKTKVWTNP